MQKERRKYKLEDRPV